MVSFKSFLKTHTIFVVTLSILLTSYFGDDGVWLKTATLVTVLLSAFIFSFLTQQKIAKSNLDNKNIDKGVNLSNDLENKLLFPESQLHQDSDVTKIGGSEKADIGRIIKNVHEVVGDYSDLSFANEDYSDLVEQSSPVDFSDGSISDEESLIEIEIPSGNYLASPRQTQKGKQEEDQEFITKFCYFHQCKDPLLDFIDVETRRMFKQQSIMDLLTEINEMNMEEDNLIEIDIAMGSIKYPRFEIEA